MLRVRLAQTLEPDPGNTGVRESGSLPLQLKQEEVMLTGHVLTRRGVIGGALALASAATLAACGQDTKADAKKVTVVTHSSFQVSDNLKKEFEKTSGFKLEIVDGGDGGELVNKLILSKDAPQGDVCFGVDNTYASPPAISRRDRQRPHRGHHSGSAEKYLVDNNRALVPIDMGDVAINIDKTYFTSHNLAEPKTFEDLAKPEYAKLLVAINPTTSTPGLAWMLATVGHFGADKFSDYWKALVKGGAKIASGWTEAYNTDFSAGEGKAMRNFKVAGIVATGSKEEQFAFIDLKEMQDLSEKPNQVSLAQVSIVADGDKLNGIVADLDKGDANIQAQPVQQITRSEGNVLGKLQVLVLLVTIVVLMLTMICVTTTMMAVVTERRKEIGLKKALGASNKNIVIEFFGEGCVLGRV